MGNGFFTVCGVIEIKGKVMLVRHTYGPAANRILCPGGYVEEGELPNKAIEREVFEETGVVSKTKSLLCIQFKTNQWCPIFVLEYIKGTPRTDNFENSEVLLLDIEDAIERADITNMSREILKIYKERKNGGLQHNGYIAKGKSEIDYAMFG